MLQIITSHTIEMSQQLNLSSLKTECLGNGGYGYKQSSNTDAAKQTGLLVCKVLFLDHFGYVWVMLGLFDL